MPLFKALAKNMAPMTNADESPYAFSYLPVSLYSVYSLAKPQLLMGCLWLLSNGQKQLRDVNPNM